MPLKKVDSFQAFWNIKDNLGRICVWKAGSDKTYDFDVDSPEEFTMLINYLKTESSIGYDPDYETISIGHEFDENEAEVDLSNAEQASA